MDSNVARENTGAPPPSLAWFPKEELYHKCDACFLRAFHEIVESVGLSSPLSTEGALSL